MKLLIVMVVVLCAAGTASAQAAAEPDVAIFASVTARELRFEAEPSVHVAVAGNVNGQPAEVVSRSDRQNLPERVQPHVTYRDIGIRLTITSTLPNIEEILDEVLGVSSRIDPASGPAPPLAGRPAPPAAKSKR